MPKSILIDPGRVASGMLFGERAQAASLTSISKETGISVSTLSDYRRNPQKITVERLARIAVARGLTDEEIGRLVRLFKGRTRGAAR